MKDIVIDIEVGKKYVRSRVCSHFCRGGHRKHEEFINKELVTDAISNVSTLHPVLIFSHLVPLPQNELSPKFLTAVFS